MLAPRHERRGGVRGDNTLTFASFEKYLFCTIISLSNDVSFNPCPLNEFSTEHPTQLFIKARGLKITHLNIRSLLPKMDELRLLMSSNPLDVLAVSETWLNESIGDAEESLPGYTFIRRDRPLQRAGGSFVKDGLPYSYRQDLGNEEIEVL